MDNTQFDNTNMWTLDGLRADSIRLLFQTDFSARSIGKLLLPTDTKTGQLYMLPPLLTIPGMSLSKPRACLMGHAATELGLATSRRAKQERGTSANGHDEWIIVQHKNVRGVRGGDKKEERARARLWRVRVALPRGTLRICAVPMRGEPSQRTRRCCSAGERKSFAVSVVFTANKMTGSD